MELNWTTFILEIINFLVLVWILKHFLYKPVQAVIARRRDAIEKDMADAKAIRAEAETAEAQYRNRLRDWEKEREAARQTLREEIEAERTRLMQALTGELQQEREKARVLEERRIAEGRRQAEAAAWSLADRFLRQLLQQLAGPELEGRIIELLCHDLASLPEKRVAALAKAWKGNDDEVVVESAYPIDGKQQEAIRQAFRKHLGADTKKAWTFRTNKELIAGLHTSIGAWTLAANLRDEMKLFLEAGRENG